MDAALKLRPLLLGIDNRNLRIVETPAIHARLVVAAHSAQQAGGESAIMAPDDVRRMRDANVHAFLVGAAFMRAPDPGVELARLFD